jgi:hypothetical protein
MHYTSLFHHTTENGTVCLLECAALTSRCCCCCRPFTRILGSTRVQNGHQTGTQRELKNPTPTFTFRSYSLLSGHYYSTHFHFFTREQDRCVRLSAQHLLVPYNEDRWGITPDID